MEGKFYVEGDITNCKPKQTQIAISQIKKTRRKVLQVMISQAKDE